MLLNVLLGDDHPMSRIMQERAQRNLSKEVRVVVMNLVGSDANEAAYFFCLLCASALGPWL